MSLLASWLASPPPDAAVEIAPERVSAASMVVRGHALAVQAYAVEPLPPNAVVGSLASPNIIDRAAVAAAVRTVLGRLNTRPVRVALIIPDVAAKVSLVRFDQVPARLAAVKAFAALPEAEALAAANKRIRNILRQAGEATPAVIDERLVHEGAENDLMVALHATEQRVRPLLARDDYMETLSTLAALHTVVDAFFDQVLVMSEDEAVRRNRLALLAQLSDLFLRTADISCLQQG